MQGEIKDVADGGNACCVPVSGRVLWSNAFHRHGGALGGQVRLAGMGAGEWIINYYYYRVSGQIRPTQGMVGLWVV